VTESGFVNNPAIKIPEHAFQPLTEEPDRVRSGSISGYLLEYPDLHPKFAVGFGPRWRFLPSRFPAVHYTAWLPPFHRVMEVQRVP
ncbi:MAG: hypothetical protein ACP5M4_01595, partial [Acidobacteriaceae bacterium]